MIRDFGFLVSYKTFDVLVHFIFKELTEWALEVFPNIDRDWSIGIEGNSVIVFWENFTFQGRTVI